MRKITKIIVHCSASPEGRNDTIHDIRKWHVQGNKWQDIGYHWVIHLDGSIHEGRPEAQAGAHVVGHNSDSIGVCYVGGMDAANKHPKDTRTPAQKQAFLKLLKALKKRYPDAEIYGHKDFTRLKACPSFNAREEYRNLDLISDHFNEDRQKPELNQNPLSRFFKWLFSLFKGKHS